MTRRRLTIGKNHFLSCVALGVWLGCVAASPVIAVSPASVPDRLLADLASDDFETRQQASSQLLVDELITPDEIAAMYRRSWSIEQRHRLLAIARHHVIRQLRVARFAHRGSGSIGIIHRAMTSEQLPELGEPAVRVIYTLAGFPGYAYLEPGDLILAVDDQPIPELGDPEKMGQRFVAMIQKHRANDTVRFAVRRDGETLLLTFRLAGSAALGAVYHAHNQKLQPAFVEPWQAFRDEMLVSVGPPGDTPPGRTPEAPAPPASPAEPAADRIIHPAP